LHLGRETDGSSFALENAFVDNQGTNHDVLLVSVAVRNIIAGYAADVNNPASSRVSNGEQV
jgi:hypothetical protein